MSTRSVTNKLAQSPSEGLELSESKESKRKDKHKEVPKTSFEPKSGSSDQQGLLDERFESDDDASFFPAEFKCHAHSSYKVLDLDLKQDEGEVKEDKVKIKFRNIHDQAFFSNCFKRLLNVKSLCVEAQSINSTFLSALKKYIHSNPLLQNLDMHVRKIERRDYGYYDDLAIVFNTYSSLEEVVVNVEDSYSYDTNKDYQVFIERNKQVRKLITEAKNYILDFPEKKTRRGKQKADEEFLINLAPIYEMVWTACEYKFMEPETFLGMVANACHKKELVSQLEAARTYHPLLAVQEGELEKLRKIFTVRAASTARMKLSINQVYKSDQAIPRRLIDVANSNEVVQYLVNEQKADATSSAECENIQRSSRYESYALWDTPQQETSNLLLKVIRGLTGNLIELKSLSSFKDIIYDALACAIASSKHAEFKQILDKYCSDVEIDINQPIQCGIFAGYTLFQLVCLNFNDLKRGSILDFIQTKLEKLSPFQRQQLLDSHFPPQKRYKEESGLTVWQYLTHHLNIRFLLQIIPQSVDFNGSRQVAVAKEKARYAVFNGYCLLQLFIQSVLDSSENYHSDLDSKTMSEYYCLLKGDRTIGRLEDLRLRSRYDDEEMPVFCRAVQARTQFLLSFSMDTLFPDFYFRDKRFDLFEHKKITYFHASILFGNDVFCTQLLRKLLEAETESPASIRSLLSEKIDCKSELKGCTLFQFAVLGDKSNFIATCNKYHIDLSSLVNTYYPREYYKYAGWTSIQVAVYCVKRERAEGDMPKVLLNIKGIDLNVCYPNNIYLGGLNVLQAALLDVSRDRYKFSMTGMNFTKQGISDFVGKLSPEQINYVCQERDSGYYGMTALQIATASQKEEHVQALLSSEKTDYTIVDSFGHTPLEIAQSFRNEHLISYFTEAIKRFPQQGKRIKYLSEVCPTLDVDLNRWVISIARENDNNHAFLIIEGLQQEAKVEQMKAVAWVAQLYLPTSENSILGKSRIDIEGAEEKLEIGKQKKARLLSSIRDKLKPLVELRPGTRLFYKSAYVDYKDCQALIKKMQDEKKQPISYSIIGTRLFSPRTYDCVTWAMEKYNSIVPKGENQLPASWKDRVFMVAKGFLNEDFIYFADESASRDLLTQEVARLSNDKKRLLKDQEKLFSQVNRQSGFLVSVVCMLICNNSDYSACNGFKLVISLLVGGAYFYLFKHNNEHEYNEEPRPRNRLS